jgi:hypothetical protein
MVFPDEERRRDLIVDIGRDAVINVKVEICPLDRLAHFFWKTRARSLSLSGILPWLGKYIDDEDKKKKRLSPGAEIEDPGLLRLLLVDQDAEVEGGELPNHFMLLERLSIVSTSLGPWEMIPV